jgi:hypothetical protein
MTRSRTLRTLGVLGAAVIIAAGCGGGDDFGGDAGTVVPDADSGAGLVGEGGQDLDGDGIPDTVPSAQLGATATIPDLSGGEIAGGLSAPSGAAPLFEPGAVKSIESENEGETTKDDAEAPKATEPPPAAPIYTGARIYVDGVIHEVSKSGAFPKDSPVFRLLSISSRSIEVELIAGEFTSGGGSGVFLDKGELVSLVNASEQLTYRVKFLRPISGATGISF